MKYISTFHMKEVSSPKFEYFFMFPLVPTLGPNLKYISPFAL